MGLWGGYAGCSGRATWPKGGGFESELHHNFFNQRHALLTWDDTRYRCEGIGGHEGWDKGGEGSHAPHPHI